MKGTVILRYVGNRPEPEERAVCGDVEFAPVPPMPLFEEMMEWERQMLEEATKDLRVQG